MGSSTARWFVEGRIIYVQNVGKVTAADFREVDRQIKLLMATDTSDHKIHVIVDCLKMEGLPALSELEGGRILKYLWDTKTGWTVVVDSKANFMLKILSGIMTSVAKAQFTMAKRLPESVHFLLEADKTLSNIPDINEFVQRQYTETA